MSTNKSSATTQSDASEESALKELFIEELKDIYWAESHLVKNMPTLAKSATSAPLLEAFQTHLAQTKEQVTRLEQVFGSIGEEATAKKCEAMNGLVKEAL